MLMSGSSKDKFGRLGKKHFPATFYFEVAVGSAEMAHVYTMRMASSHSQTPQGSRHVSRNI
jgi:hypothetical protein